MITKNTLSLILLFVASFISAQSTDVLDQKNGFKTYKLNALKSSLSNLGLVKVDTDVYLVSNNPEKFVFDYEVEEVHLIFQNDKVKCIMIAIKSGQKGGKIGALSPYFENLFGRKTYAGKIGESDSDVYEKWVGKKVELEVQYLYKGYQIGWMPVIAVSEVSSKKNDGF